MKQTQTVATCVALLVASIIIMPGCATLFKGSTDTVSYSSDPAGSKVYINGQMMGTTPFQLNLKSNATYTVEFRKDGYNNRTVVLTNSVGAGWIILDVLFGLVPIIVDAATGDWYSLDQEHVTAALEKQQEPTTANPVVVGKTDEPPRPSSLAPVSDSYAKLGTGHFVKYNLNSGKTIMLEDGSTWEVHPNDIAITSKWDVGTPISVGISSAAYPYQLIDVGRVTDARAKYKGMN